MSELKRLTPSDIQALSTRDPELQELLSTTGPWPDPPFTDIEQCRGISDYADNLFVNAVGPTPDHLLETQISIPTCAEYTSTAYLTRPAPSSGAAPGPLIVLLHPGGFFLGSPNKLIVYTRAIATLFGGSVLSPTYRFAPEHPFPAGIDDAWAVLKWAASHADQLGADPAERGFLVGGQSSAANFAVVLARKSIEENLQPPVTGIWAPIFIGLGDKDAVPEKYQSLWQSHEQNCDALVIDRSKESTMWDYYKPDFKSPLFNPLVPGFDLAKMPKTFVQVAGEDMYRDDGLILGTALQDHGVEVKLEVYPGVPHSFWIFAPSLTASKKFVKDMVEGIAWLLGVNVDELPSGWETAMGMPKIEL